MGGGQSASPPGLGSEMPPRLFGRDPRKFRLFRAGPSARSRKGRENRRDGGGNIADLASVEIGERAAEREDRSEGVALVHLRLKDPDAASERAFDIPACLRSGRNPESENARQRNPKDSFSSGSALG